jgi:DNA replication protein DnaC
MRYQNAKVKDLDNEILLILNKNKVETDTGSVPTKGILFLGDTGRGKTYAMYAIRNWLQHQKTSEVKTWQEFLFAMKLYYSDSKNNKNELELLKEKDYIFLDDLGAENNTEYAQEMLYMIVNHCYVYEKPLFVSTNLDMPKLIAVYTERIASRLIEMCEFHEMKGENKRLK